MHELGTDDLQMICPTYEIVCVDVINYLSKTGQIENTTDWLVQQVAPAYPKSNKQDSTPPGIK